MQESAVTSDPTIRSDTAVQAPPRERIIAIDALRGFDMFWISGGQAVLLTFVQIFCNPLPEWLKRHTGHVRWEGFVAWDLIMPLFLFVVGAAMPFSFARRRDEGESTAQLYWKIIRRTLILFVLGMAVQGNLLDFKLSTLHIFSNTLQAIAVGYFIAGIVMLNFNITGQVILAALMMLIYWALLTFVPFGDQPAGSLSEFSNFAYSIERFVMRSFIDGTKPPYTWVLSSMVFAATTLLGVFAGHILRADWSKGQKFFTLAALGLACLAGGYAWSHWGGFPIIKHIWTSSMVLWAGGWSYLLLALFYLVIDIAGFRRWAFPFVVIGSNAILIYVLWDIFQPFRPMAEKLVGVAASKRGPGIGLAAHLGSAGPFLTAFTAVLLAWLLLYYLYRRKIFIRI
jgi:predicted acyltransferase